MPKRREGLRREEVQARIQNGSETLANMCSVDVRKIVRNTVKSVDIDTVESLTARRPQPGRKNVLEEDDQERKKVCKTKGGKGFQERKISVEERKEGLLLGISPGKGEIGMKTSAKKAKHSGQKIIKLKNYFSLLSLVRIKVFSDHQRICPE